MPLETPANRVWTLSWARESTHEQRLRFESNNYNIEFHSDSEVDVVLALIETSNYRGHPLKPDAEVLQWLRDIGVHQAPTRRSHLPLKIIENQTSAFQGGTAAYLSYFNFEGVSVRDLFGSRFTQLAHEYNVKETVRDLQGIETDLLRLVITHRKALDKRTRP